MRTKLEQKKWTPFLMTALGWLIISAVLVIVWTPALAHGFYLFLAWSISLFDLYAMAKLGDVVITQINDASNQINVSPIQIAIWGFLKLASLGGLGVLLYLAKDANQFPLLLGVGTLVTVPLVGGFWWNSRELRYA